MIHQIYTCVRLYFYNSYYTTLIDGNVQNADLHAWKSYNAELVGTFNRIFIISIGIALKSDFLLIMIVLYLTIYTLMLFQPYCGHFCSLLDWPSFGYVSPQHTGMCNINRSNKISQSEHCIWLNYCILNISSFSISLCHFHVTFIWHNHR